MKKEILKLTGLTEDEFYRMYPTEEAFTNAYPAYKMKMGGLPEAFPQIATANNFFSYGVPVPPTIHAYGGPIYPQIQTEAQFFSPVYSNSNNAYAVGGSYMEAYPQAKLYPQGPVGGSAFYAMQNGGSSMQEPGKDQTFYTQKTNDFFDKLRQTAYKNIMAGIMNSEDDSSSDMKQLAVGQFGGNQPFNFYIPNNKTSWRNIREQKGKGLGDLTPEQLEAIKTGAANVADISYETRRAIFPKNRVSKVNIKFKNQPGQQEFKGAPNLMPGQKGFDPTVPGQPATTTTPAQNQQTAPGAQGMSPYGPYMGEYLFGPDNAPSVNAQVAAQQTAARTAASSMSPDADYITNSKYPDLDEKFAGTNMTQRERLLQQLNSSDPKEVEYAKYRIGAMQDWDAMQVGRNSGTSQAPSNTNSMDPNVAAKKAAMQTPSVNQAFIDAQKPMSMQEARDLASQVYMPVMMNPGARQAWQEEANRTYKEVAETGESGSLDREKLLGTFANPEDAKNANYPLYLKGKMFLESDANKTLPTFTNVPPSQIDRRGMGYLQNAYYNKPESMFGEETEEERYIRAINAKNSSNRPVDIINEMAKKENWDPAFTKRVLQSKDKSLVRPTVVYKGYERPAYFTQDEDFGYGPAINQKYGGPYVLPMYQGMTGPSQTGFQAPWQKTLDMVNPENYKLNAEGKSQYIDPSKAAEPADQGEFEVGYDVSRVKNFDPYFAAKVQWAANTIDKFGQDRRDQKFMRMMMRPDQWANTMDQSRGDYAMNQPAGANFRPDQMVPVSQYGGMMMYDTADLFFLTPQMLKKTKGKK